MCVYIYCGGLVIKLCPTFATPWTVSCQAPLSMGLSRQEYWSGLPFPSLGDLPDPGIEPGSPALQAGSLPVELQGKIYIYMCVCMYIRVYTVFLSRLSSLCSGNVNGLLCYLLKCFKLVNGLFLLCWSLLLCTGFL